MSSLLERLKAAREERCEKFIAYITAKEDLRAAENLALERRVSTSTLGSNAELRRLQIDGDCAAERGNLLSAETDLTQADTALAIALDAVSPYAPL